MFWENNFKRSNSSLTAVSEHEEYGVLFFREAFRKLTPLERSFCLPAEVSFEELNLSFIELRETFQLCRKLFPTPLPLLLPVSLQTLDKLPILFHDVTAMKRF